MIGVLLQPSLSSANHHQASSSGASAFLLQTLSQSCIMVGFLDNSFPRMEGTLPLGRRGHSQIADPYVYSCYLGMGLGCRVCYLNLKGYQQVELSLGFVVPEFSCSAMSTLL